MAVIAMQIGSDPVDAVQMGLDIALVGLFDPRMAPRMAMLELAMV